LVNFAVIVTTDLPNYAKFKCEFDKITPFSKILSYAVGLLK